MHQSRAAGRCGVGPHAGAWKEPCRFGWGHALARGAPLVMGLLVLVASSAIAKETTSSTPRWSMNATIIEACSCPMFCQCYFNTQPAAHGGHEGHGSERFCQFNNAFRVNRGRFGSVKLDGAKFWVAGDLGAEFSDGRMDWAVLTFDPSVSKQQREAIQTVLGSLYPVKWDSFTVAPDATVDWNALKDHAEARLGGGKIAEVMLGKTQGMTNEPVVIKNLKYWGAPRNNGFVLMPSALEAYRVGDKPFEFKNTNGFMITFDIASSDIR